MTAGADAHQGLLVSGRYPELEDALCDRVLELKRDDAWRRSPSSWARRPCVPVSGTLSSGASGRSPTSRSSRSHGWPATSWLAPRASRRSSSAPSRGSEQSGVSSIVISRSSRTSARSPRARTSRQRWRPRSPTSAKPRSLPIRRGPTPSPLRAPARGAPPSGPPTSTGCMRRTAGTSTELGACDNAEVLRRATAGVRAGARRVIVYGLYDLNPAQEALFAALLGAGADAFVPLPSGSAPEEATAIVAGRAAGRSASAARRAGREHGQGPPGRGLGGGRTTRSDRRRHAGGRLRPGRQDGETRGRPGRGGRRRAGGAPVGLRRRGAPRRRRGACGHGAGRRGPACRLPASGPVVRV